MSNNAEESCRICLKSSNDYKILDSTYYVKFFIQATGLKDFTGKLWLCVWCKATLKRTINFVDQASKVEKSLHNMLPPSTMEYIDLYNFSYTHNTHIDIPPTSKELDKHTNHIKIYNIDAKVEESVDSKIYQESNESKIYQESNASKVQEYNDSIINESKIYQESNASKVQEYNDSIINESKIYQESNASKVQEYNDSIINESDNSISKKSIPIKITNRKKLNYEELKFEMKHLNLEEQLNEVELKKMKNRNKKFVCDYCGTGFLTVDLFDAHKLRHSEAAGPHNCTVCQLYFKSSDVLSQHMLSHRRRFRCVICSVVFNRWSHCLSHRYKCGGGSAPVPCGYCLKIFSDEHSLNVHIKGVHKTVKKYVCEQCQVGFASKQRLTVHMRTHSGIKPFSCPHCPNTFATNSNMRAHSAVHDDVTRHYCVECNTHYKSAKSLKRHFEHSARHIVIKDERYLCKECSKQFPSEKSLNRHIEVRHNKTYRCSHCNKTFSSNTNLNKHIKCIHTPK